MQNGIIDEGNLVPPFQQTVSEEDLADEKQMAAFAGSKEFQRLKEHFEGRVEFYQQYLPDGRSITGEVPTPEQWSIANAIIGEFNLVINTYLNAAEAVKDAKRRGA